MRIGIAVDHGGFALKGDLHERLVAAGHEVVDFGANTPNSGDDYPDFVVPLGQAVVEVSFFCRGDSHEYRSSYS
jgi:ribose 5-phosphate isomerase B